MATATLKVEAKGEREIVMIRDFNAPRKLVFDAYTKPDLVKRWLTGPPGWVMTVCEVDLRVGGKYRYVWRKEKTDTDMGMGGEYREVKAPSRLICTEVFDQAWYEGECVGVLDLVEKGGKTTLTQTLTYSSRAARDGVIQSGMASGVEHSYSNLDSLLETL